MMEISVFVGQSVVNSMLEKTLNNRRDYELTEQECRKFIRAAEKAMKST